MSTVIVEVCDICSVEQRSDAAFYWAAAHKKCAWQVPPDGINGGSFSGTLCVKCRTEIHSAIGAAVGRLTPTETKGGANHG